MPVASNRCRWVEFAAVRPDAAENPGTRVVECVHDAADYRRELVRHYETFSDRLRSESQHGVALVAIDRDAQQVAGVAFAAAPIGRVSAMIVGRHSHADLQLTGDETLSLRQLAVIVEPLTDLRPGRGVTYRVVDLRSGQGLMTEDGRVLGGFRADGPGFFQIGRFVFFAFVTGDPTDWPPSARDAWSFIPERIYLDETSRFSQGSGRRPAVPLDRAHTVIQPTQKPELLTGCSLLDRRERPVLEISVNRSQRLWVGSRALDRGVLIGRADRCDASEALDDRMLSRVHLLLLRIGDRVYAVDTASTNGSHVANARRPSRVCAVKDSRVTVTLGGVAELQLRSL